MRDYSNRKGVIYDMDDNDVISVYSLAQTIADGVLVEIFKERWTQLALSSRGTACCRSCWKKLSLRRAVSTNRVPCPSAPIPSTNMATSTMFWLTSTLNLRAAPWNVSLAR